MQTKEQYEIISHPNRFQILKGDTVLAQVHIHVTDNDFQHAEVQMPDQQYLKSDFDLGMTIVPGLTRSIYLYDQIIASFTYINMYEYECRTWQESTYTFSCDLNTICVYKKEDGVLVAQIEKDQNNNHVYVVFEPLCPDLMKLVIALFPCLRF